MLNQTIDAILPAAGRIDSEFAEVAGVTVKALITFDGKTVLERMIDTLRETNRIGRIVVVGPAELAVHTATRNADDVLPEGNSGPDNIYRGLDALRRFHDGQLPERVLIMATDVPFATPEAINTLLDACPPDAEICVPIVRWDVFAEKFPPDKRFPKALGFWARLRDGQWRLGNAFIINVATFQRLRPCFERAFAARKSAWAMSCLLGLPFIILYLVNALNTSDVKRHCEKLVGCTIAVIRDCPPELAFDLDAPDAYRYAVTHWQ